jgi:hypothetical protein
VDVWGAFFFSFFFFFLGRGVEWDARLCGIWVGVFLTSGVMEGWKVGWIIPQDEHERRLAGWDETNYGD